LIYKKCVKSFLYCVTNLSNLEFMVLQEDRFKRSLSFSRGRSHLC